MKDKNDTSDAFSAIRIPEFRNFCLARLFLTIALQMQWLAVGWQIYSITKDPLSLGLIGLAEAIPALSIALYGGHFADSRNRKTIILSSLFVFSFGSATLLAISFPSVFSALGSTTYPFYAVIFVSGIVRAFISPAVFATMSQIVPKELYANAATWNSVSWQTGAVTGPMFGGFLYAFGGASSVYSLVIVSLISAFILMSFIKKREIPTATKTNSIFDSLTIGVKYVFKEKIILGALSLDLFAVLFGGATALLPAFASDILNVGTTGLGLLRAAPSVGSVLMALYLTNNSPTVHAGRNLFLCVFGFGFSMILFGLSTVFWLSIVALFLSGIFDTVSVVIRSTIMQTMTPDEMRGRVSAVNMMFIGSSNEIGAFESGVAARLMGTGISVVVGGIMTLFVALGVGKIAPNLRKLRM